MWAKLRGTLYANFKLNPYLSLLPLSYNFSEATIFLIPPLNFKEIAKYYNKSKPPFTVRVILLSIQNSIIYGIYMIQV